MNWILIAITSGMLMTSSHETEEACLGRKAMLEKEFKMVNSKCVDMMKPNYGINNGSMLFCNNGICNGH